MGSFRKIITQRQTFSWLLVSALILQLVVQVQFHLHHDEITLDDHVIDYHIVTDAHPDDHPSHENTHEFKSTPDVILKKNISPESLFLPVVFLFLLVSVIQFCGFISYIPRQSKIYRYLYYGLAPPTRAPPSI